MASKADAFNPKFPNTVARDTKLSPVGLFLTAYRSTFIGPYKLAPNQLGKLARQGLGKNVAKAGMANARAAGYLDRHQPPRAPGFFAEVEEKLTLPKGKGRLVSRAWFDGTLDVKEMAALLFLRAGTGRGKDTWRRELEERFQWSERMAARVIDSLMERDLLDRIVKRAPNGTHLSTTYTVPQLAKDRLARTDAQNRYHGISTAMQKRDHAKPDHAKPACGKSVHSTYSSRTPHILPSEEHLNTLPSAECPDTLDRDPEMYASRPSGEAAPTISDLEVERLHHAACVDTSLLGWVAREAGPGEAVFEAVFEDAPSDEAIRAVYEVASDSKLCEALRQATDRRIAYRLLEPDGLYVVRWLAAFMVSKAEARADQDNELLTPIEALGSIIEAIWARIGDQPGEWLNSYALIGKRLAADQYGGWTPRAGLYTSQSKKAALDAIVEADRARTLAPRLRRDVHGFNAFVEKQAAQQRINGSSFPAEIESIIATRLRQHMIDGRPVSSIRSWKYFEEHIAEEMQRMRARGTMEGVDDA